MIGADTSSARLIPAHAVREPATRLPSITSLIFAVPYGNFVVGILLSDFTPPPIGVELERHDHASVVGVDGPTHAVYIYVPPDVELLTGVPAGSAGPAHGTSSEIVLPDMAPSA